MTGIGLINYFRDKTGRELADEFKLMFLKYDEIKKTIATAENQIRSAIAAYKKKQLNAKNRHEAENLSMYDCLAEYGSREDIHTAYGWDAISEEEYDRLTALWDQREEFKQKRTNTGGYFDEVVRLLDRSAMTVQEPYIEELFKIEETMKEVKNDIKIF